MKIEMQKVEFENGIIKYFFINVSAEQINTTASQYFTKVKSIEKCFKNLE